MITKSLLKKLYSLNKQKGCSQSLEVMHVLTELFQHPEKQFKSIHIAGTNGKGSVSTKMAKALQLSDPSQRIGLYTSPHISSFRERITINGILITEEDLTRHLENIFNIIEKNKIAATFFEITTLLAFCYFAENQVDIAVIETGIGGRLDSTNVISPCVSVITSLSFDHTDILGKTLEEIAREKAGIIKDNTPVVTGARVPKELIAPYAKEKCAPHIYVEGVFATYDEENSATAREALTLLNLPEESILEGCKARPPCRMEKVRWNEGSSNHDAEGVNIILDVAHNPDGIEQLFKALQRKYPERPFRILVGLSQNKDLVECVTLLRSRASAFHLVEAKNPRALPAKDLYEEFIKQGSNVEELKLARTLKENLLTALQQAKKNGELLLILGSFFIMAEVRNFLGIIEPVDPFELNEFNLPKTL